MESRRATRVDTMTPREPKQPDEPVEPPDPVEEASKESFPASDAPFWEPLHPGEPTRQRDTEADSDGSKPPDVRDRP